MRNYGYNDKELVPDVQTNNAKRLIALVAGTIIILAFWFGLNQKLLFGDAWMSATYDNEEWKTNEGNLHTYGAWDIETHIWKTEYILEYFPNFQWNPFWYLGMPLFEYYQFGFYVANLAMMFVTGENAARSALLLVIFSHLLATLLTFLLCYKISKKIWVAALCSTFVLSNTFITLRSYGWEPITVVFLFLYPLGLLLFLQEPLRPFRFWLIVVLGVAYLCHPLLWFSLCMTMGLYLFTIAIRKNTKDISDKKYLWQYFGVVLCSLLIGAVQFISQMSYEQVTSGAHMGVKYLPYYQVPPNIITLKDFLFDAGNLKGPGPIIMIAFLLIIIFLVIEYRNRNSITKKLFLEHELVSGLAFVLFMMVFFYYIELYNLFPMNLLRSIQYHRIIPEFVITAAALVAGISNIAYTRKQKVIFHTLLIVFVLASSIIVYIVQEYWQTTPTISENQEFIYDDFEGRISFPYTDQSLAVRNSFTKIPQTYGYYEQGITNAYADELFSVSSGFHNAELTLLYLQAANVKRLYINNEEGERDRIVAARMNGTVPFIHNNGSRYSYFEIPLTNLHLVQAVDVNKVNQVQNLSLGCRTIFKEEYCGSNKEEFVSTDSAEIKYLEAYVDLVSSPYSAQATAVMENPEQYVISVTNATQDTAVIVKMTYAKNFKATINGQELSIQKIGPDFMLITPNRAGDYVIIFTYHTSKTIIIGIIVSTISILGLILFFIIKPNIAQPKFLQYKAGDL